MPFKMKVETTPPQEKLNPGIYTIKLTGFKPAASKNGDSVNLNPQMEIVNDPDHFGYKLFDSLNSKFAQAHQDFSHAFGLEVEDTGDGTYSIPGEWDGNEKDPKSWKYTGPLLGREAQVEVGDSEYNGKVTSKIRRYVCQMPNCDAKHIQDLLKSK